MWWGEGHKDQCAVTVHAIPSRETAGTHEQVRTLHLHLQHSIIMSMLVLCDHVKSYPSLLFL